MLSRLRDYRLGFAVSRGQIPFSYDSAENVRGAKAILQVDGLTTLPTEGEETWASSRNGFKSTFSYGAVIDPSKLRQGGSNSLVEICEELISQAQCCVNHLCIERKMKSFVYQGIHLDMLSFYTKLKPNLIIILWQSGNKTPTFLKK